MDLRPSLCLITLCLNTLSCLNTPMFKYAFIFNYPVCLNVLYQLDQFVWSRVTGGLDETKSGLLSQVTRAFDERKKDVTAHDTQGMPVHFEIGRAARGLPNTIILYLMLPKKQSCLL